MRIWESGYVVEVPSICGGNLALTCLHGKDNLLTWDACATPLHLWGEDGLGNDRAY